MDVKKTDFNELDNRLRELLNEFGIEKCLVYFEKNDEGGLLLKGELRNLMDSIELLLTQMISVEQQRKDNQTVH